MIVIAYNQITGELIEFPQLKYAAEFARVTPAAMSYRIKAGCSDNKGWVYRERVLTEEEMTIYQLAYLKKKQMQQDGTYVKRTKETTLNEQTLIRYQKDTFGVCITPCPYSEAPKPMVGSAKCQLCGSFIGISKSTLEVSCKKRLNLKKPMSL